ncbi:hypothetical protein [Paenibacillus periandrae]|uniref:hypothetical protein n=1 Tax=Paenibacillus periandrae TaxID=1761741 RepID=UPI001F09FB32|nr:hypothetical protein [Paenibacillus periandrae]
MTKLPRERQLCCANWQLCMTVSKQEYFPLKFLQVVYGKIRDGLTNPIAQKSRSRQLLPVLVELTQAKLSLVVNGDIT